MEEKKDKSYKLNRLFCIAQPSVFLVPLIFVIIAIIGLKLVDVRALVILIGAIVIIMRQISHKPKSVSDEDGRLIFEMKIGNRRGKHTRYISTTFIVSNFSFFEIKQNPIEKLFGAAHIEFSGISREIYSSDEGILDTPEIFKIYGFRSYAEIKNDFEKYLPY